MGARAKAAAGVVGLAALLLVGAALAACEVKTAAAPARGGAPVTAAPSTSASSTPATASP
jgi:hypothetical protein